MEGLLKMSRLIFALLVLVLGTRISYSAEVSYPDFLPIPAQVSWGEGALALNSGIQVELRGNIEPRLNRAVERFLIRLEVRTGIPIHMLKQNADAPKLLIECIGPGETVQSVREDESYRIDVGTELASITAATPVGVIRALETILQLVDLNESAWSVPATVIIDKPRFHWRGLLVDSCRHWLPQETIHRIIDSMAVVKLNVLHWHLTDDQGFRVESRYYPKLHEMGSDSLFYTQEQIRETIAYARDRGIRIVPEFDLPGHSTSWFVGYPELASKPGPYAIERIFAPKDPVFDPTRDEIYEFLDRFIGEMATLFPDEVIHIGGDEVTGKHWQENEAIQAYMEKHQLADTKDLQAHFTTRLSDIITRHGKRMMGWEEIQQSELPEGTIMQAWHSEESLIERAKSGYNGVLSWGYYLDHMFSAEFHYGVDPLGASVELNEEQSALILGGEACMWSELVTSENIDAVIWPRTAAIAERLWSNSDINDVDNMYLRLDVIGRLLEEVGSMHRSGPRRMLERMAESSDIENLERLAEILEPPEFYGRHMQRVFDQTTPLNTFPDAVLPESLRARQFGRLIDRLISDSSDKSAREEARRWLLIWNGLNKDLEQQIKGSPLLQGMERLTKALSNVSEIGLEAISYLEKGKRPPKRWYEKQKAALALSFGKDNQISMMFAKNKADPADPESFLADLASKKKDQPLLQIAIVSSIEKLVNAAAGIVQ